MWGLVGLVVLANIILLGTLGFGLRRSGGAALIFGRRGGSIVGGAAVRAAITQWVEVLKMAYVAVQRAIVMSTSSVLDRQHTGSRSLAVSWRPLAVRAAWRCRRPRRGGSRPGAARGSRGRRACRGASGGTYL